MSTLPIKTLADFLRRSGDVPPDRRIEFRMGINLGDIIRDGRDIHGDGVNIAARLEALAEPGRICVSRVVRDQVRDKLDHAFEDMGEQSFKNIARPVRVYGLRPEAAAGLPASSAPPAAPILQPARSSYFGQHFIKESQDSFSIGNILQGMTCPVQDGTVQICQGHR